jgi:hypothetical protein
VLRRLAVTCVTYADLGWYLEGFVLKLFSIPGVTPSSETVFLGHTRRLQSVPIPTVSFQGCSPSLAPTNLAARLDRFASALPAETSLRNFRFTWLVKSPVLPDQRPSSLQKLYRPCPKVSAAGSLNDKRLHPTLNLRACQRARSFRPALRSPLHSGLTSDGVASTRRIHCRYQKSLEIGLTGTCPVMRLPGSGRFEATLRNPPWCDDNHRIVRSSDERDPKLYSPGEYVKQNKISCLRPIVDYVFNRSCT